VPEAWCPSCGSVIVGSADKGKKQVKPVKKKKK